jgi:hypothetical protein
MCQCARGCGGSRAHPRKRPMMPPIVFPDMCFSVLSLKKPAILVHKDDDDVMIAIWVVVHHFAKVRVWRHAGEQGILGKGRLQFSWQRVPGLLAMVLMFIVHQV